VALLLWQQFAGGRDGRRGQGRAPEGVGVVADCCRLGARLDDAGPLAVKERDDLAHCEKLRNDLAFVRDQERSAIM